MEPERVIQEALESAGDPAGAFLWRRVCRDLDGDLRVGVVSRDDAVTARTIRALSAIDVGPGLRVDWVPLHLEPTGETLRPTLGAIDRLLSVHALLWATPATAALGAEERAGMEAIVDAGAPTRRQVIVVDVDLVEKMSDQPEQEVRDVLERVRALCDEDWGVAVSGDCREWVDALRADRVRVARDRRRTVAAVLLRDARRRAEAAVAGATEELERVRALVAAEDEKLDVERRRGRRTAAHLLGATRRHTERLLVDLRAFLLRLEADMAAQVEAVDDLQTVKATLPHWLHHVVEQWMGDRLAMWRADVLLDLAELDLAPEDLDRAELLVPAIHAAPVRVEGGWGQRIGITAAVGSGAALLAFGMWIPGLLAVTGGLAWSALGRRAAAAHNRRALADAATDAVRKMGTDADRLLRDQIATLEDELSRLGDERASELGRAREAQRKQLEGERATREQRVGTLQQVLADLDRRIATMETDNGLGPRDTA
jgi:hypothetical protein